ncbi:MULTISPECIES: hypothetical protein [unclassified Oceanispirochaeta]|uniref:hypothetical protein n=1 Tax=unclassified Oceanispirochaeta TaxID=2635722 RepID=UPI0011C07910|nr:MULTISPECIES: hypothetical protein [unclassified Oceanispirochaeta]MBF9016584.1 hypothetical protein [Oceanispirochaeta sp. M2]NPD73047.1 hypothetical protein [Oceanispirochaeta sp. M1]
MKFDVTFHPSWWNEKLGISFSEEFFDNPRYRIESDLRMRKFFFEKFGKWGIGEETPSPRPLLGSDLIASGYLFSQLLGCEVRFGENIPPEVLSAGLTDDEAAGFIAPNIKESPLWQKVEEQISWLLKEYGQVHSALNLQGVLNLALDLRGESIFIDMYQDKNLAERLLNQCFELLASSGKRLSDVSYSLSGGVTAITNSLDMTGLYVHSNCSVEMVSLENYRDFLQEYDIRLSGMFQPYGIHHCGQSMEHVVGGYAAVPELSFAEVGAGSDIETVRKFLPDCWLNLRYSPVRLAKVEAKELKEELRDMYRQAGGKGSETSISCVGIDSSVPDRQVDLFLEIAKELGDS